MNGSACSRLEGRLALRDEDRLSTSEEKLLREHLDSCACCAAEALRHDPALLFLRDAASAGDEVLSAEERESLVGDVLAAAGAARADRRLHPGRAVTGLRIAASLLLAASLVGAWYVRDRASSAGPAVVPVARAAEPRLAPLETFSPVEDVGGEGAVVYQFPASAPGEPTVVFLVDRNADI